MFVLCIFTPVHQLVTNSHPKPIDLLSLVIYTDAILEILKQGQLLIQCLFIFEQKKFRYHEREDPKHCRDVFEAIAAKRYSAEMYEARDYCFKRWERNIEAWKKFQPHWCLDHPHWQALCDIFFTEDFEKVSLTNKDNRTKSGLLVANHCGSASSHQHFGKLVSFIKY